MNSLEISLNDPRPGYFPGDRISCHVLWDLEKEPVDLIVSLFWRTEGKGTSDSAVAVSETLEAPGNRGERDVEFDLPAEPPSFSGKLISLRWGLEVHSRKPNANHHVDFVLSPTGTELLLGDPSTEAPSLPKGCFFSRMNPRNT